MLFSSVHFLFLFLPIVLTIHFMLGKRFRNLWLLVASIFFYAYGEKLFTIVMVISIVGNYYFGLWLDKEDKKLSPKIILALAVMLNLGLLGFYKYGNFAIANVNSILSLFGSTHIPNQRIHLPIGISFFTFEALSYLIDVYRREMPAQKNFVNIGLFITHYPHLIAGPIIRYHDVATQLLRRSITREKFFLGLNRFIVGLGKKVLIANTCALVADRVFGNALMDIAGIPSGELTFSLAWIGLICYAIQLYFDFSGYSDMAIGLGHMLGFTFLENFNYPFIALSIKDHWKRWHISLTNWMRDYLYISLGGNRVSVLRNYFNLVIVFVVTGFWHGAEWHFLFWGLYNGLFLVLERAGIIKPEKFRFKALQWFYMMFVILIGFVLFRADSLSIAFPYIFALFGFAKGTGAGHHLFFYVQMDTIIAVAAGIIGSAPLFPYLDELISTWLNNTRTKVAGFLQGVYPAVKVILLFIVLLLSIIKLAASTYNPFIYFRF